MRSTTFKFIIAAVVFAAIALFPADGLRALGLGEARVDSYLGQALDVSIRLIEPDGGSLDSLTVAPASAEDYERLGIPSTALGLGLGVSLDRRVDPPVIKVRSNSDVADPVVQILIDARWSSGRVLREYTLFLDPPTLPVAPPIRRVEEAPAQRPAAEITPAPAASQPVPVQSEPSVRPASPRVSEPDPEPVSEQEPTPTPATQETMPETAPVEREDSMTVSEAEPEVQAAPPSMGSRSVGPVAPGQTLWSIAYAWRPSTGLTMNQVMLAIFDQNPQAFIDGNVNQLRRDAMLTMPSSDDIFDIDVSDADRRMRAQMQSWQSNSVVNDVPVISDDAIPEVMSEADIEPVEPADDSSYRLEVVPPEGESVDDVPAVSEEEVDEASSRLVNLEDQIYAEGLENDELYRQIEEIRDAIEARDMAGMAVANEELANLETRLREAREAQALEREIAAQAEELASEADELVDGAVDEVDEYFSDLEDELGVSDDAVSDESQLDSQLADAASDAGLTDEASMSADNLMNEEPVDTAADSMAETDGADDMPMTRTSTSRDGSAMMWALIAGGLVLLIGAAVFIRNKLRNGTTEVVRIEPGVGVDAAREKVIENRSDLGVHLALLGALADTDDKEGFSDALDAMYTEVDHDDDPNWQEALNLAVIHAPDHPLLTPRETGLAADDTRDGLDDRTREMLGILDEPETAEEVRDSDADDDAFLEKDELSEKPDEDDAASSTLDDDFTSNAGDPVVMGEAEMDLAALSDRLDDEEALDLGEDSIDEEESLQPDENAADFSGDDDGESVESHDPAMDLSDDDDLDLDFEFSGEEEVQGDSDSVGADSKDEEDQDEDDSPTDTLDMSGQSASNDTLRMDPDELAALSAATEEKSAEAKADAAAAVRADDTLDLVSSEVDYEDLGDRELEAFLADGDEIIEDGSEDESILDMDLGDGDDDRDQEGGADSDHDLSDDDADVKLDLARAYISMDDTESATTLLEEIVSGGSSAKRSQAQELLDEI